MVIVSVVEKKECRGEREISSTYIKEALCSGDIELTNELLGYPFPIIGEVKHGRRIGRTSWHTDNKSDSYQRENASSKRRLYFKNGN